ncbi:hypothetical protein acdb102_20640 [Acidothermaceae bacterium B102]|nr:hypothetical protein acdb102_20640 [Acidothermaceae bacterium B102]
MPAAPSHALLRTSALERVPPSVTSMTLDYVEAASKTAPESHRSRVVSGAVVTTLARELNAIAIRPDLGYVCWDPVSRVLAIGMAYGVHRVSFTLRSETCGDVDVVADGQRQPELRGSDAVWVTASEALGIT